MSLIWTPESALARLEVTEENFVTKAIEKVITRVLAEIHKTDRERWSLMLLRHDGVDDASIAAELDARAVQISSFVYDVREQLGERLVGTPQQKMNLLVAETAKIGGRLLQIVLELLSDESDDGFRARRRQAVRDAEDTGDDSMATSSPTPPDPS